MCTLPSPRISSEPSSSGPQFCASDGESWTKQTSSPERLSSVKSTTPRLPPTNIESVSRTSPSTSSANSYSPPSSPLSLVTQTHQLPRSPPSQVSFRKLPPSSSSPLANQ